MNLKEFMSTFENCKIDGEKIVINSEPAKIIKFIKDNYGFSLLKSITAVDNIEKGIELIYRLYSIENNEDVIISVTVNNEAESVSELFDSAVADEKEIYDLFGIKFIGNSELERLYMPESWQGYPLRKDYEEKDERLNWNE